MGLSVLTGQKLAITPTVKTEMYNSVCYAERRYIRENAYAWKTDYIDMVGRCVGAWIEEDILGPSGVFELCSAETMSQRLDWMDRLPLEAFKSPSESSTIRDMEIVADGLAGGADALITNNCSTMFHPVINDWVVKSGIRNRTFMLEPQMGLVRLLRQKDEQSLDWPLLHQCAINMVIPKKRKSPEEERRLLMHFAEKLNANFPSVGNAIIVEERTISRDSRWELAAGLIQAHEWHQVRAVEDKRMDRMRKGRSSVGLEF